MVRAARKIMLFLLAALCLTSNITCQASAPETSAEAFILMDAASGRVLASHNELAEKSIASTTKIMTALVALEHSTLSEKVTVRREDLREGSSMYLAEGETLTMEELLYGLLLPSGNDAAECIASYCGGGARETFIDWMNEKAASLGMTHTAFRNASGLDESGHHSCALDMARLAAYAMRDPVFVRIVSTASASLGTRTMTNHNKLLASYPGCIGLKTGYTGDAGRTLVTCAERDGLRLIAVTLHDGSDWADHAALYDYGFSAYTCAFGAKRGAQYAAVTVGDTAVGAVAAESFCYPITAGEALSTRTEMVSSLSAPIVCGQKLGELVILCGEAEVGRVDLVSERTVGLQEQTTTERPKRQTLAERLWDLLSA